MRLNLELLGLISLLFLSACAGAKRLDAIETVKVVERQVPVPTPCGEKVTRPITNLTGVLPSVEDKVEALTGADAALRSYVAALEAAALACGVTIK
jgi:hypothetical protein